MLSTSTVMRRASLDVTFTNLAHASSTKRGTVTAKQMKTTVKNALVFLIQYLMSTEHYFTVNSTVSRKAVNMSVRRKATVLMIV